MAEAEVWTDYRPSGGECEFEGCESILRMAERKGRKLYRLPTDEEWSWAVGTGDREKALVLGQQKDYDASAIANVFPWGQQWSPPADAGNYFGEECKTAAGLAKLKAAGYDVSDRSVIERFNDGKVFTAAAGSFPPNGLGIYDLGGNVWEWCHDPVRDPAFGPESGQSELVRGGSWFDDNRGSAPSSGRDRDLAPGDRVDHIGFRVVVVTTLLPDSLFRRY